MSNLLDGLKPFEDSYYGGVEGCWFDFGGLYGPKAIYRAERAWLGRQDWIRTQFSVTSQAFGSMQMGQR